MDKIKPKPFGIIYCATNKVNGKRYVGQTGATLNKRKSRHKQDSVKRNNVFCNAFKKYGMDGFEWRIITSCVSQEHLDEVEKYYIKIWNLQDRERGYNLAEGGRVNRGAKRTKAQNDANSKRVKEAFADGRLKSWNKGKTGLIALNKKSVKCVETGVIYESLKEAAKATNSLPASISSVVTGRRESCQGLHWEFIDKETKKFINTTTYNKRAVRCVETEVIYKSGMEASRLTGVHGGAISAVCNGKQATCGGFHWEFVK